MRTFIPKNAHLVPTNAERVFHGEIFDVYQWQQKMFDGSHETFEMAKRPDTVEIIGIRDDKIVIIRDEQPGRGPKMSFPGGRHDNENETELDAGEKIEVKYLSYDEFLKVSSSEDGGYLARFHKLFREAGSIDGVKRLPDLIQ